MKIRDTEKNEIEGQELLPGQVLHLVICFSSNQNVDN
jgi:hypothetical protein